MLQILVNLLTNATHAIVDQCDDRRIDIRVREVDDGCVEIAVQDTGVGIADDILDRVFEAGFTTRKEGHGFGLHASANAAREMGGELLAHSDGKRQGATFRLRLLAPKAAAASTTPPPAAATG